MGSSCSQAETLQPVSYAGNTTTLEWRVSWLPAKTRSLDIALIACQGYFVTGLFPSRYNAMLHSCFTGQAAAHVHRYLFSFPPLLPNDAGFNCTLEGRSAAKTVGGNGGEGDSGWDPPHSGQFVYESPRERCRWWMRHELAEDELSCVPSLGSPSSLLYWRHRICAQAWW